jgi:hypothetical protein
MCFLTAYENGDFSLIEVIACIFDWHSHCITSRVQTEQRLLIEKLAFALPETIPFGFGNLCLSRAYRLSAPYHRIFAEYKKLYFVIVIQDRS